jgi:hypothetical protein
MERRYVSSLEIRNFCIQYSSNKNTKGNDFNAFLIVTLDNEEIAHFNLNELNK